MHAAYSLFRFEVDVTDAAKILLFCRNAGEIGKLNCYAWITHSIRMKSWWKEFIVHNNALPNCLNENTIRLMESCWANICRIKATCSLLCLFISIIGKVRTYFVDGTLNRWWWWWCHRNQHVPRITWLNSEFSCANIDPTLRNIIYQNNLILFKDNNN